VRVHKKQLCWLKRAKASAHMYQLCVCKQLSCWQQACATGRQAWRGAAGHVLNIDIMPQ
jgi:hypothetical protein